MLIKDRCIGVFDLESLELDAFSKEHQELLTLLASQAAVAIDNARLYEEVRRNEERIERNFISHDAFSSHCCPPSHRRQFAMPMSPVDSSRRMSWEVIFTTF